MAARPAELIRECSCHRVEEGRGGKLPLAVPTCPRGGYAVLRAEVECVVVMSACPLDLGPAGANKNLGVEFEISNS